MLALAMVLALTRCEACACGGRSEEPAEDRPTATEPSTDDGVPPAVDPSPLQPDAEPPGGHAVDATDVVAQPADDGVHFVARGYGESSGRRFGVRGPRGLRVAAECARDPCVLDAWWRRPGRYVVWIDEPGQGERAAVLQLVGDELEISFDEWSDEVEVTHRIEGVELLRGDGRRARADADQPHRANVRDQLQRRRGPLRRGAGGPALVGTS